MAEKCEIIVCR